MVATLPAGTKDARDLCNSNSFPFIHTKLYIPCAAMLFAHGLGCESKFTYGMAKRPSFWPIDDK